MRMRMTTLTWRPIIRINCTLTSDRLFTKFRCFWLLVENVFFLLRITIFLKGYCLYPVKTLLFAFTLSSAPYFFYSIYGALAAQGEICKCADCRIYNIYVQFGRLTLNICIHCTINCEDTLA